MVPTGRIYFFKYAIHGKINIDFIKGVNTSNVHLKPYALYNNNHHHQALIANTMGSANIKAQIITNNKHEHLYYFKWKGCVA